MNVVYHVVNKSHHFIFEKKKRSARQGSEDWGVLFLLISFGFSFSIEETMFQFRLCLVG